MSKRPAVDLDAVMDQAEAASAAAEGARTTAAKPSRAGRGKKKAAKAAAGPTTLIGGHFPPDVAKQLALIAAEEGSTKQALLGQALNLLFVQKGKKRIAL